MPIKKAAFKAVRQSKKRRTRNLQIKKNLTLAVKAGRRLVESKKTEEAKTAILKTIRLIDKAASKGIIKKNTAARKKSRLIKKLNSLLKK